MILQQLNVWHDAFHTLQSLIKDNLFFDSEINYKKRPVQFAPYIFLPTLKVINSSHTNCSRKDVYTRLVSPRLLAHVNVSYNNDNII